MESAIAAAPPPRRQFSKAALAIAAVNAIEDQHLRLMVGSGLVAIAKNKRGSFPNVRPAPTRDILEKLAGVIRQEEGGEFRFSGDEATRLDLSCMMFDKEGYLVGITH